MKNPYLKIFLALVLINISACETLRESSNLTEAAIKQLKLNHQRNKQKIAQKKSIAKSPAILAAEKLRDQDPNNPAAWYDLGVMYWEDYEKTDRIFSHDQAINNFRTLLEKLPGNVSTVKALYNIYYRDVIKGRDKAFDQAKNYFNQLTPEYQRELNPPSLAQYIYLYYQEQKAATINYSLLHQTLLQAIQEQPQSDFSYIQLAKLYTDQAYYPLAIATLKLGLAYSPTSATLLKAIGSTYEARASANGCHYDNRIMIQKASNYYLQAVSQQAEAAELHRGLARLFIDRNMPQLAAYETNLLLDSDPSPANYAFAAHNLALMGKKDLANRYLDSAKTAGLVASDPAYHEVYMVNGDWLKAALSFTDYIQPQKQFHVYDAIKADIIARESGINLSYLLEKKQITYANDWQTLVHAWWEGKISREKLEPIISNQCERAEFYFYLGYQSMQSGDLQAASSAFNTSLEQQTFRFIERPLAKSFLAKIQSQ